MVAKINPKLNTENSLSLKKAEVQKNSASADATRISSSLSGKAGSFGTLTNSTLASSLEKTSATKTSETSGSKEAQSTEAKSSSDNEALFASDYSSMEADINEVSTTMSVLASEDIPAISYAKTGLGNAQSLIKQADSAAQSGDWSTVITRMNEAKTALKEAQRYALQAGDKTVQDNISIQMQICDGSIQSAQNKITQQQFKANISSLDSAAASAMSGSSTSTSSSLISSIQNGLQNGMKQGTENAVKKMFGTDSTNGNQNTGSTGSTGSAGKTGNSTGKAPTTGKTSGTKSSATKGLEYDKNNKQIKNAVEQEALPIYNQGTEQIKKAQSELPQAQSEIAEATKSISGINYQISNIEGKTEEILEKYSAGKEKIAQKDNEISKKQSVIDAQKPISNDCQTKITQKTGEKTKAEGELNVLKTSDLANAQAALAKANAMPETNEAEVASKNTAIIKAEEQIRIAEEKIRQKEAEIKQLEADIKDLQNTKKEADEKIKDANEGLNELKAERDKISKEVEKQGKSIEEAKGKAAELKKDLDSAYDKKTKAEATVNNATAQIDAGKMKQDLGENLRDNAVQKVKQENGDGATWYNPLSWF